MSLPVKYTPTIAECDGSNRRFSTLWPFFEASDLRVTWVAESGKSRTLETTEYKVRGGKDGTGVAAVGWIETAKIYALKEKLVIERVTVPSQEEAFQDAGAFQGKRIERSLDRAMMCIEELAFAGAQAGAGAKERIQAVVAHRDEDAAQRALAAATAAQQELRALRRLLDGQKPVQERVIVKHVPAMPAVVQEQPAPAVAPAPKVEAPAEPERPEFTELIDAKSYALAELDRYAEIARCQFATPGKDMVYIQKQNEARACLDDDEPLVAALHPSTGQPIVKYPHLEGMIGVYVPETRDRQADLMGAAVFVLGKAADWKANSARVEAALYAGKQAILASDDIDDTLSIPARVIWPRQEGTT